MTPQVIVAIIGIFASLVIGIGSGYLGALIGVKIGLARMEMRHEFMNAELTSLTQGITEINKGIAVYKEDVWLHDVELAQLYSKFEMPRVSRQRMRG
jgi:hypothetical protein